MSVSLKIKVGSIVQARKTSYRIEAILSMDEFAATNLDTLKREILHGRDLDLVQKPAQRVFGRPDARSVSVEKWDKASSAYELIEKLLNNANRTLKDVEDVAAKLEVSVATVYRRLGDAQAIESPVAMLRRSRLVHAQLTFDLLPEDRSPSTLEELVIAVARDLINNKVRCTGTKFCTKVIDRCPAIGLDKPHPNTVRRLMMRLEPGVILALLKGRKASLKLEATPGEFGDALIPFHTFQIDHTPLDVIIVHHETRQPIGRAWITVVLELYSRTVPGFAVSLDAPSTGSISNAIRHAVLRKDTWLRDRNLEMTWPIYGKPVTIHADNAKEFRGLVLRRVCKDHTMDLVWRPVKKPRYGAHIERFMGTLAIILKDVAGTTYSNPQEKLDYDSEGHALMSVDELECWLAYRIGVIYHQTKHSGINNETPLGRMNRAIMGDAEKPGVGRPPIVVDEQRLYRDFLPRFRRTVTNKGVRIENVHYFDDDLRPLIGEADPDDPKKSRKWEFGRDDRQISPIYFFNPRTNEYVDIPYANLNRPLISAWELHAATNAVAATGGDPKDEEQIFKAYEKLKKIEEESGLRTKAAQRKAEQERRRKATKAEDDRLPGNGVAGDAQKKRPQEETSSPPTQQEPPRRVRKIVEIEDL